MIDLQGIAEGTRVRIEVHGLHEPRFYVGTVGRTYKSLDGAWTGRIIDTAEHGELAFHGAEILSLEVLDVDGQPTAAEVESVRAVLIADGTSRGTNAGAWVFDGNTDEATYARVLQGIEAGDPEILDLLPGEPLSGEWADGPLCHEVILDAVSAAGLGELYEDECWIASDLTNDLSTAFEDAWTDAVFAEVERVARLHVQG